MKKLISFDVGIKNMAYCIFDIDETNTPFSVGDWKIMNMLEPEKDAPLEKCSCNLARTSNPKICGKNAKYFKHDKYYCLTHAKSSEFILPQNTFLPKSLKKKSLDELIEFAKQYSIQTAIEWKTKKKALESLESYFGQHALEVIKKQKRKTAGDVDLISIGRIMKDLLNQIPNIADIDTVIIENQISPIANRMKTIQGMLAQYFIITTPQAKIEFVSSANKLKQFQKFKLEEPLGNQTAGNDYKQHKLDGVYYTGIILGNNDFLRRWTMDGCKKKDDLADCFLQGIWYLYSRKLIFYAENLKINSV